VHNRRVELLCRTTIDFQRERCSRRAICGMRVLRTRSYPIRSQLSFGVDMTGLLSRENWNGVGLQ
jgi:hypothetical protein